MRIDAARGRLYSITILTAAAATIALCLRTTPPVWTTDTPARGTPSTATPVAPDQPVAPVAARNAVPAPTVAARPVDTSSAAMNFGRSLPVDLAVALPGIGDGIDWRPSGSPIDRVVLVAGASIDRSDDPPFPGWSHEDATDPDVARWRDFATLRIADDADPVQLAVMLALVPIDDSGASSPGVVQLRAGEVDIDRAALGEVERVVIRLAPGEHDVVLAMPAAASDATTTCELLHASSPGWLDTAQVDAMFGDCWPGSAYGDAERRRAKVTLVATANEAGELTLLGVPRGFLLRDGVTRIGPDGRAADVYLASADQPGRIAAAGGKSEGVVIGTTSVVHLDDVAGRLPRFAPVWEDGLDAPVRFTVTTPGGRPGARRTLAIGEIAHRDAEVLWRTIGPLGAARGTVADLTVTGLGIADYEASIHLTPSVPVVVPLRRAVAPWTAEVEIIGVDAGISVPVRYWSRAASDRPTRNGQAWMDTADPLHLPLDGRVNPNSTSGAYLDADLDSVALADALRDAWGEVHGSRAFDYAVVVEQDFARQAKEPPQGTLDVARRVLRHREHVRVSVVRGEWRWSLAEFVDVHGLRAAYAAVARPAAM